MAQSLGKRDKAQRVADLIDWGLNAPVYSRIVVPFDGCNTIWESIIHMSNLMGWKGTSLRELGAVGRAQHTFINISRQQIYDNRETIESVGKWMIAEGLEIAVMSGCIAVSDDDFILEAVYDKPVRALTHGKEKPDITIASHFGSDKWKEQWGHIIHPIEFIPLDHFCVEFSVFSRPVGKLKTRELFWEYEETKPWTPETSITVRLRSQKGTFSLPYLKSRGDSSISTSR